LRRPKKCGYSSLQQRMSQTGMVLEGGLDGGTILVDGKVWGVTPRPDKIPVQPGAHQVRIEWQDRSPFQASIVVPAGQVVHLKVVTPPAGEAGSEEPAAEPLPPAASAPSRVGPRAARRSSPRPTSSTCSRTGRRCAGPAGGPPPAASAERTGRPWK